MFPGLTGCDDPGTPANGGRQESGDGMFLTLTFSCDDGYIMIGDSVRRCIVARSLWSWSGIQPSCTRSRKHTAIKLRTVHITFADTKIMCKIVF